MPLNQPALDLLFESVDLFGRLLAGVVEPEHGGVVEVGSFLRRLADLSSPPEKAADDPLSWLDDSILGVLTEYEEHRLRENVRLGRNLFRIHAAFDILLIDKGIEALKEKLKVHGEVITYLPSVDGFSDDSIELDIIVGTTDDYRAISALLADDNVSIHQLTPTGEAAPQERPPPPSRPTIVEPTPERTEVVGVIDTDEPQDDAREDVGGGEVSLRSLSQTVRVDLRRLDVLMNLVGELGVVQTNLGGVLEQLRALEASADVARDLTVQIRDMTRKLALLQQGILDVRMVPIGQVFDKLARVVRKLGRELDKEIRLSISGEETVLDKLIVEELSDPLMHMIRNCIDHGIEPTEERVAMGKPQAGRVELRAFQRGNRVVIEVDDDGRGIDWQKIRDVAIKRQLVTAEEVAGMGAHEIINMIFAPGFSTRDQASAVSGRGVGMDVVKTNIAKLSGMIDVATEVGRGTRFSITLPVTLAIIQALVIQSAGHTFCIPLNSVLESIMVETREIATVEGHEVITLRGKTLPLLHLSRLFALKARGRVGPMQRVYVVVVGLAQHRVGLVVDELLGQQDVVIKPLGSALRSVPGIAGATELGANRTVLLLDVGRLVDEGVQHADAQLGLIRR
ncbi:MAG: chemotaxis protein CheA [Myxococcales bacterium]|nr:chemotaxis protein CheA [Myxococcales bacterium]